MDEPLDRHKVFAEVRFANMSLPEMRAAYLELEAVTRQILARANDRTIRKADVLKRIANQLQSIQELIQDAPSVS